MYMHWGGRRNAILKQLSSGSSVLAETENFNDEEKAMPRKIGF